MRPGEIRSLAWAAYDREGHALRLHARDAKTGVGRVVPLAGPVAAIIERRYAVRVLSCPFISHRDGRQVGEFRKAWKTACKAAGVVGMQPYDLRRTAVRNMIRAGATEQTAMAISGHQTRAMLARYNIVDERDMTTALELTGAYVQALPAAARVVPLKMLSK